MLIVDFWRHQQSGIAIQHRFENQDLELGDLGS
jgi:hypothetical protein